MKNHVWALAFGGLAAIAIVSSACGGGGAGAGGETTTSSTTTTTTGLTGGTSSTGTTSSSTTSSSTTSTGTTSTGAGGAGPSCDGVVAGPCGACLEGSCCSALAACKGDGAGHCVECLVGMATDPSLCDAEPTKGLLATTRGCLQSECNSVCGAAGPSCDAPATAPSGGSCVTIDVPGGLECNPVTNAGCDGAAGYACEAISMGTKCFPPPNDAKLCGDCSNVTEPYCGGTLKCLGGKCARFCCDDGDCGTGICDRNLPDLLPGLGLCVAGP